VSTNRKSSSEAAESVRQVRARKARRRAAQKLADQIAAEAEILTPAQQAVVARARKDLIELARAAARARDAGDRQERGRLLDRRREVADLLVMMLRDAGEKPATEAAQLMTARPRGKMT
jgi:hypothetical protein